MARYRRPRCTPLRGAAGQHNVALCKPPRCHGACDTSSPRAGAGTRRASASLRITHVHVYNRPGAARRHRGPTRLPHTSRTSLCAPLRMQCRLRVDIANRFGSIVATRLHACCARLHSCVRAARPRSPPACTQAGRLNRWRGSSRTRIVIAAAAAKSGQQEQISRRPDHHRSERVCGLRRHDSRRASPSGLRPDTPSAGHHFPLLTRSHRRRRAFPAEAEPAASSATICSPVSACAA